MRKFEVAKGFEDKGVILPTRSTKGSAGYVYGYHCGSCSNSFYGNNPHCAFHTVYCNQIPPCKKEAGAGDLQGNGIHKLSAYFTNSRLLYACVNSSNSALKCSGYLLYALHISVYFRGIRCYEKQY